MVQVADSDLIVITYGSLRLLVVVTLLEGEAGNLKLLICPKRSSP